MENSLNGNIIVATGLSISQYRKLGVNDAVVEFMKLLGNFHAEYEHEYRKITYSCLDEMGVKELPPFVDVFDGPETLDYIIRTEKEKQIEKMDKRLSMKKSSLILRIRSESNVWFGNLIKAREVFDESMFLAYTLRNKKRKVGLSKKQFILLFDDGKDFYSPHQFRNKVNEELL